MTKSYQDIFDACVRAVRRGRRDDPGAKECECDCRIFERGCYIDEILGERAKPYPVTPLCTGCITAPYVGEREHREGSELAREMVAAGVPPTHVSSDILDHFAFIHDLSGEDWQECIRDAAESVSKRHRIELNLKALEEGVRH